MYYFFSEQISIQFLLTASQCLSHFKEYKDESDIICALKMLVITYV